MREVVYAQRCERRVWFNDGRRNQQARKFGTPWKHHEIQSQAITASTSYEFPVHPLRVRETKREP